MEEAALAQASSSEKSAGRKTPAVGRKGPSGDAQDTRTPLDKHLLTQSHAALIFTVVLTDPKFVAWLM